MTGQRSEQRSARGEADRTSRTRRTFRTMSTPSAKSLLPDISDGQDILLIGCPSCPNIRKDYCCSWSTELFMGVGNGFLAAKDSGHARWLFAGYPRRRNRHKLHDAHANHDVRWGTSSALREAWPIVRRNMAMEKGEPMTVPKVPQKTITQTIDAVQWTAHGDDAEAAAETRKRARQCGPDAVAFLYHVLITDKFSSVTQRVRAASTLLEAGEFLSTEAKETGLFREAEGSNGPDAGETS